MGYSIAEFRRDVARGDTLLQRRLAGWRWQRANRARLTSARPAADSLRVVFAIPLIGRARAGDWARVGTNLAATLGALRRQTDPRWEAILCGQDRPDIAALDDPRVTFLGFPPRADYDKGSKLARLRAEVAGRANAAGYYFVLDADDLVHPGLVAHILADDNRHGYLVDRGYMLDRARLDLAVLQPADAAYPHATEFHRNCGSSSALWFDTGSGADIETLLAARMNHRKVAEHLRPYGVHVARVPFHAAMYVMNHGENMRERRGLMAGKMKHFDLNPVRDPARRADIAETFGLAELFPGHWPPG
jgi:hypothetical protein